MDTIQADAGIIPPTKAYYTINAPACTGVFFIPIFTDRSVIHMALIQCPECSGQISDKAIICPHCGFPVRDGSIYTKEPKKKSLRLL